MSSPTCAECKKLHPSYLEEGTGHFFCGSSCQFAFIAGKRPREEEEEENTIDNLLQAWAFLKNLPETNAARKELARHLDSIIDKNLLENKQDVVKKILGAGYESPNYDIFRLTLTHEHEDLALWLIESGKAKLDINSLERSIEMDSIPLIAVILKAGVNPNENPASVYEKVSSVDALRLLLDAGLTKGRYRDFTFTGKPIDWNGLIDFVDRRREDLALFLLSQGANPLGRYGQSLGTLLLEAADANMFELVRELMKYPQLSPFQENFDGLTALSVASIPMQMVLLVEFYKREFFKQKLSPPTNVTYLMAVRTLQDILCTNLSRPRVNLKKDLLQLAAIMKIPQDIQEYWKGLGAEELCQEISDVLAIGGVWDAEKLKQQNEKRLTYFEEFLGGLDFLNIRWRGRTFQEVLEELRDKIP